MPKRYKLWIEIEEISDDPDGEGSTRDFAQCIRAFDEIEEARFCRDMILAVNCPAGSDEQKEARRRIREAWDRMDAEEELNSEEVVSDGKE